VTLRDPTANFAVVRQGYVCENGTDIETQNDRGEVVRFCNVVQWMQGGVGEQGS
jgi:hypothetical protein